jgi:hypothetical protein
MSAFPQREGGFARFDHLTLAEVAECERLLALDWAGKLRAAWSRRTLHRLLAKRHRPLYDEPPNTGPGARAA